MPERLIAGIFPNSDPQALAGALSAANVDPSTVKVVAAGASTDGHTESEIDFLDVAIAMESNSLSDDMTHGTGVIESSASGTGVPGLTDSGPSLLSFSSHHGGTNYLAGLGFPDDEIDNFNDAIADGRAVVTLKADDAQSASIADALRAAGLLNVRTY